MKRTTTSRKLLAAVSVIVVYYVFNITMDRLIVEYLPAGIGFSFDQTLDAFGLRLPVPAVFTLTKLLSAFFAGAAGAHVLKDRSYILLSLPVLLLELPLLYVGFGEGGWLLAAEYLLASVVPVVVCCMIGIWIAAGEGLRW